MFINWVNRMLGSRALLFSLCAVLMITVPATAESDYQRVIRLHNQIVGDAAGVGLDSLSQRINELIGGDGNGIDQNPATSVQSANLVHVLIRAALTSKQDPEQAAAHFLKAYLNGKVKGDFALNHLRSVLIVYVAALLDKNLSEDDRAQQTQEVLQKLLSQPYKGLKLSLSKDVILTELNQLDFFKFYTFFVKNPGAQKVMLDPDRVVVNYTKINSESPPIASPISPSAERAVSTLPLHPKSNSSPSKVSGKIASAVSAFSSTSQSPISSSSANEEEDFSYVPEYLKSVEDALRKIKELERARQENKAEQESLKKELEILKPQLSPDLRDKLKTVRPEMAISYLQKYLSNLKEPVRPQDLPKLEDKKQSNAAPTTEALDEEIKKAEAEIADANKEIEHPTVKFS